MPNTAVKPANAESTWGEAPWEDRKPLIQKERIRYVCVLFFVYVRLPILPGPWDKQRSAFKGAARRIKATESLMSGPYVSVICPEEAFMCADPTDR